jgi:hypothetical protein
VKNKLSDLRNHLFETLEALKDKDQPMDIDRAIAVRDVAQVIVESAKVEVKFLDVTGEMPSDEFFDQKRPARGSVPALGNGTRR